MMARVETAVVLALSLAVSPANAGAQQQMAASFEDLSRVLGVGDVIYVTEKTGLTTWGRIDQVSESSVMVLVMERDLRRAATLMSTERRVFTKASASQVTRSDSTGRHGPPVYPASWHRVDALPRNAEVVVTIDTGERRTFRFDSLERDTLRLSTASGGQHTIPTARIRRIVRRGVDDSVSNGLIVGALSGAGTMVLVTAAMYSQCDAGCDAPAYSEMYPVAMGVGAAIGAAAGWINDLVHKGTDQVFPTPAAGARLGIAPLLSPRQRGVAVSIAF